MRGGRKGGRIEENPWKRSMNFKSVTALEKGEEIHAPGSGGQFLAVADVGGSIELVFIL